MAVSTYLSGARGEILTFFGGGKQGYFQHSGMLPYALWCFNIVGARRGAREILTLGDHRQTI